MIVRAALHDLLVHVHTRRTYDKVLRFLDNFKKAIDRPIFHDDETHPL
jgi:Tat protein secretion system quality control protein TatD with DNase activity